MIYSIQHLPECDRPRERFARCGAEALSSAELLALILGSGTKERPVLQLAQEILAHFGSVERMAQATLAELCSIKGVGQAKAIQIKAALSLGMRASQAPLAPKYRIDHPVHAYHLVKEELEREKREIFLVILQDVKGYVICYEIVAIGILSNVLVHPREVFYPAIRHKAASLILVHNHPSGDPTPSAEDYQLTKVLIESGQLMGMPIQDHLIIGHQTYYSLRQKGFSFA